MKFSASRKILLFIAIVLVAVFAISRIRPKAAATETFGVVKRMDLTQRVTINGQVWPLKRLDVKPPFTGYITKLYVKVGDAVKKNDPLITFSPSLQGETNFPLRTGFAGTVTQVWKSEGEYVLETGDQNLVLRVEDLSELSVLASVPELDVAKLKVGQSAVIRISSVPGETFKGKIAEISLSAKDKEKWGSSGTEFQLKVSIDSHDPRLMTGMSCIMDIITDQRKNVLTLAHEYIQSDDEGFFVTTADGVKKTVKLGLQTDEAAEVLSGLNENERVRPIDFLNLPPLKD